MGLCAPHRDLTSSNSISKYGELGSRRFQSILACRDVSKKFLFLTFTDSVIVSSLGSHAPRSSQNNYRMAERTNVPRMSSLQWQWQCDCPPVSSPPPFQLFGGPGTGKSYLTRQCSAYPDILWSRWTHIKVVCLSFCLYDCNSASVSVCLFVWY